MLTRSRRTVALTEKPRRTWAIVDKALLVPEVLLLGGILALHALVGQPVWTALLGLGIGLLFGLRLGLLYIARWQLQHGAYRLAERLVRRALLLYPRSADSQHLLAAVALAQGQAEKAEEALRRAISFLPGQAALHAALSGALLAQDKLQEARMEALRALGLDASHPLALLHLAGSERSLQTASATIRELVERGLNRARTAADEAALRCVLAGSLLDEQQPAKALLELRRVETLLAGCSVPQRAALHSQLGELLRLLEQPEQAKAHFSAVETLDPHGRHAQFAWHALRNH